MNSSLPSGQPVRVAELAVQTGLLHSSQPGRFLRIVDFAQIPHMSLPYSSIASSIAFDNAPVMVFFPVFFAACRSQVHAAIFAILKEGARG
jgi:hypothetical protein